MSTEKPEKKEKIETSSSSNNATTISSGMSLVEAIPGSEKTLAGSALLAAWLIIWSSRDELVEILREAPDMWYIFVAAIIAGAAITVTRYVVNHYTVGQDQRHAETLDRQDQWFEYLEAHLDKKADDHYNAQRMEFAAQNTMLHRLDSDHKAIKESLLRLEKAQRTKPTEETINDE